MNDIFFTIKKEAIAQFKNKNSRFIARVFPTESEQQIKETLLILRKEYYDARHHCYAYILGFNKENSRSNDDGEPSGSAGKPIYNQLLSKNITNVLAVVIRYFGGVKLGVPGLINAYKTATKIAIEEAEIEEKHIAKKIKLSFKYADINAVMQLVQSEGIKIRNQFFDNNCEMDIVVRESLVELLQTKLNSIGIINSTDNNSIVF